MDFETVEILPGDRVDFRPHISSRNIYTREVLWMYNNHPVVEFDGLPDYIIPRSMIVNINRRIRR